MFCSNKDKIPEDQRANVIYKIRCPGCGEDYVGKTERCLKTRLKEHATSDSQPMYQHLINCDCFKDICNLMSLPDGISHDPTFLKEQIKTAVFDNTSIVDYNNNWSVLEYLEAYYIKTLRSNINVGLKASKELLLF